MAVVFWQDASSGGTNPQAFFFFRFTVGISLIPSSSHAR
jgi:hypothetical protein